MDLMATIQSLRRERARLDKTIAALEAFKPGDAPIAAKLHARRGRKSMGPEEREQVGERIRRYWAARRSEQAR